ncbi:MAG TPA: BREX-1 system adenine-specific DNA-methyltransferase PglX [Dysgonamonadaceae bacterium]|nr:BREX-1 system adenine-specific DNA-methyltransferase PglX [Dysgonamonadaceae bacterium]
MNTNQLKRFAQEARTKLLRQVGAKMDFVLSHDTAGLRGRADTLQKLQEEIRRHGKEAVIDKVAYTWFNRLVALRFMDVNGYQPIGMSVVTPATPSHVSPQILTEAHSGNIPGELKVNREQLFDILDGRQPSNNPDNDVYRMLLVAACNNLSYLFPFLFERIEDYTELLLPDDLTSPFSIVTDIVNGMADEDCREVEIIGWLYQFYISEKKDEVFASKSAVKKEDIPAATQLFTPRWIVEYMVQNTVGKLWLQNRPSSHIREHMPYYIESESGSTTDYLKLESIEDLKLLDQACGSGHILVYGFELLHKIYEEEGYSPAEIPQLIIEKNLYGLEIDERAAQLAGFALMMKARGYHRRFFRREVKPNIKCFSDLTLGADEVKAIFKELHIPLSETLEEDLDLCRQATNLGSLIQPQTPLETLEEINNLLTGKLETSNLFSQSTIQELQRAISHLISLQKKYHCTVANPPYMGGGKMNAELSKFVKSKYPISKADLFSCFIERSLSFIPQNGLNGLVTMESWMFLSSFEALRKKIIENTCIQSLTHFGWHIMRIAFGTVTFILEKRRPDDKFRGTYSYMEIDNINRETERPIHFPVKDNGRFKIANQKDFEKIPGSPIGYWVSEKMLKIYDSTSFSSDYILREGLKTGDNDRFIKLWSEISYNKINYKWFPHTKGGNIRRWYGNHEYVLNYENNGEILKKYSGSSITGENEYFKAYIAYGRIGSGKFSSRYTPKGFIPNMAGLSIVSKTACDESLYTILAITNSKLFQTVLNFQNPTLNNTPGLIASMPLLRFQKENLPDIKINISISRQDWDAHETSWDFQTNELIALSQEGVGCIKASINDEPVMNYSSLELLYQEYKTKWTTMFHQLHANEEELNRQFIDIYGLQDELTPDVPLEEITILQEETTIENGELVFHADEVFAQFVSYAVGCMFGRYSLDKEGLILANQGETLQDYLEKVGRGEEELTFVPDRDNIIPVLDDEWFRDDIVERFYTFLKASFGEENFRKNLDFVEESLGMDIRKYFTRNFYKDHIRRYKKRPIYWMFSSPKGYFNVLVYLHRYTPDTINRILNSYLKEFIEKLKMYRTQQEHIEVEGSVTEQNKARKEIDRINVMLEDCMHYETEILYPLATERIALDLDDGVLVNYNKLGSAVAKVAGLNDKKTKEKVRGFDWIDTSQIRD